MKIRNVVYGLGIKFCCNSVALYRNDNGRMIYYGMVCDIPKWMYSKPVKEVSGCDRCLLVSVG